MTAVEQLLCVLVALIGLSSAQTDAVTPWLDVCTSEDLINYRAQLCPATFVVSTLAFNPLYPLAEANVTIILQPSEDLQSSDQTTQLVDLDLPGFEALGTTNTQNANLRNLPITAGNTVPLGVDPFLGYNTEANPLFTEFAQYDIRTRLLTLEVRRGQAMLANRDTEITVCCMRLPAASPKDFTGYTIEGPTSLDTIITIPKEPILSTPEIDPGLQWEFLRVSFDPPVSQHVTIIHLTLRPANALTDRARIILTMPLVTRVNNVSGTVNFNTANSIDGADWMFFESSALWDASMGQLTFFLREGKTLQATRQVTLSTEPGEFQLPIELAADSPTLTVSARSFDNIDEVVRETPVTQSSAVPHVRNFVFTRLAYTNNVANQQTNVMFHFMSNRPFFAGSVIYLRLSGFTAQRVEVPLKGITKAHFRDESAYFRLPENILELHVVRTIYSDEYLFELELVELILPPALYVNDTSLLAWNSDPGAPQQPIDDSPEVGNGYKTFKRSQLAFEPSEPRLAANISFTLEPSIVLYQGDQIIIHMFGFACTATSIPLLGPDAFRVQNMAASWTQQESRLVFTTAENEIIGNAAPFRVSIGREVNFRLPDKLSENDGILRIEGKGALINLEPVKKIPKIGEDKYVIESRVVFEPEDESVNAFTRISFSLVLNTDVLPNSNIYIKLGGLIRDPGRTNLVGVQGAQRSGQIKLSGANGPLFVGEVGYWDQDAVLLTVQMISTVQIYAGERVRFFIERDQDFKLPFSAYPNDPSFRLAVPEAGIPERPFLFSTRVSQQGKQFAVSEIFYGARGAVAYPSTVVEFNFRFQPNVNLPAGTTVRLTLPGFTCPFTSVPIGTQEVPVLNEKDLSDFIRFGQWNQLDNTFDLVVPVGQAIYRQLITVLRIMESGGFRLPTTPLLPNDMSLTIQAIGNVVIFEEPIKTSPRVVDRSFQVSEFIYAPPQKDSIFQLKMILQPTVNITSDNDIIIFLPGFRNSLSKVNIHIMGEDRGRIQHSIAYWNETTARLTLTVPRREVIPAFTMLDLRIEESQGFILPSALNANDTTIRISSVNNIQEEPIKKSPMVGNGPFTGHLFCMYHYEVGTRSPSPICATAVDCNPPLTDPCNPSELTRCGCDTRVDEVFPLMVLGFNLQQEDSVHFLPYSDTQLCHFDLIGPAILNPFSEPVSQVDLRLVRLHRSKDVGARLADVPLSVLELSEVARGVSTAVGLVGSSCFRMTSRSVAQTVQQTLPGLLSSSKIYVLSAWKDRPETLSLFSPKTCTFQKVPLWPLDPYYAVASRGGNLYILMSGEDPATAGTRWHSSFHCWHTATGRWRQLPPRPGDEVTRFGLTAAGSSIYALGGIGRTGCSSSAHRFNLHPPLGTSTGRWETLPSLLQPRCDAAAVSRGSVVFLLGGTDRFGEVSSEVESLEVWSKEWRRGPSLLGPRHSGTAASTCESVVLFGGSAVSRGHLLADAVSPPEPECLSHRWGFWASLPSPASLSRHGCAVAAVPGKVFVFGGYEAELAHVDRWDTETLAWDSFELPVELQGVCFAAVAVS